MTPHRHRILWIFAAIFIAFTLPLAAQEVVRNMPIYYEQLKAELSFPLSYEHCRSMPFAQWHALSHEALTDCLAPEPERVDFNPQYSASEVRKGYEAHKILVSLTPYSRVPVYVLKPEGQGPFPAVVLFHDHGAHFTIGKEKVVHPFAVADTLVTDAERWADKHFEGQFVGDYLAEHGYVVIAADALLWGERGEPGGSRYDTQQALAANLLQMGRSWGASIVWDDVRTVDFAASLPFVDAARIGVVGFSFGAHRAWFTAAVSGVVAATVAVCWMGTTESLMTPTNNQARGGSAYAMLIPNLRRYLDYPHVAQLICPRPVLFINGTRDKLFPVDGVQAAYNQMGNVWHEQGAAARFKATLYDAPHTFNRAMQFEALQFLDRWLK